MDRPELPSRKLRELEKADARARSRAIWIEDNPVAYAVEQATLAEARAAAANATIDTE